MVKNQLIGVAGLASAGKDTIYKLVSQYVQEGDRKCHRFSFADEVRKGCMHMVESELQIDVFNPTPEEKKIIRPILVAFGEAMKARFGQEVWLKKCQQSIVNSYRYGSLRPNDIIVITDVRFPFELQWVQDAGGCVVHISREGVEPPNEYERLNDPVLQERADLCLRVPDVGKDIYMLSPYAEQVAQLGKDVFEKKSKKGLQSIR